MMIKSLVLKLFYRFFSLFSRVNRNTLLFITKSTSVSFSNSCISDNVLCILTSLLDTPGSDKYRIYYVSIRNFPSQISGKYSTAYGLTYSDHYFGKILRSIFTFYLKLTSKYIFTASPVIPLFYKRKRQYHPNRCLWTIMMNKN